MKDTANLFRGNKTRKIYEWQRSLSGFLARRKWRVRIQSESNPVIQTMLTYIAILHNDNHTTWVVILSAAKIGCTISTFTELGRDQLLCAEITLGTRPIMEIDFFISRPPSVTIRDCFSTNCWFLVMVTYGFFEHVQKWIIIWLVLVSDRDLERPCHKHLTLGS